MCQVELHRQVFKRRVKIKKDNRLQLLMAVEMESSIQSLKFTLAIQKDKKKKEHEADGG